VNRGWVRLYRRIEEHELWKQKPFSPGQAWVDMILSTNHDTCLISRSQTQLAKRWGWSRQKVCRFIKYLHEEGMVETIESGKIGERASRASKQASKLYICNYLNFQQVASKQASKQGEQSTIRKDNNTLKEQIYIVGFHWNKKGIIHHGPKTLLKAEKPLKKILLPPFGSGDYWTDDVCKAICNYAEVLGNDKYYWTHRWPLWDFLQRGFHRFVEEADPLHNFLAKTKIGEKSWIEKALKKD